MYINKILIAALCALVFGTGCASTQQTENGDEIARDSTTRSDGACSGTAERRTGSRLPTRCPPMRTGDATDAGKGGMR